MNNEMEKKIEVDEIIRLGKYEEGNNRPSKIKLRSQVTIEMILNR